MGLIQSPLKINQVIDFGGLWGKAGDRGFTLSKTETRTHMGRLGAGQWLPKAVPLSSDREVKRPFIYQHAHAPNWLPCFYTPPGLW